VGLDDARGAGLQAIQHPRDLLRIERPIQSGVAGEIGEEDAGVAALAVGDLLPT
jgi:hypothetical protein